MQVAIIPKSEDELSSDLQTVIRKLAKLTDENESVSFVFTSLCSANADIFYGLKSLKVLYNNFETVILCDYKTTPFAVQTEMKRLFDRTVYLKDGQSSTDWITDNNAMILRV